MKIRTLLVPSCLLALLAATTTPASAVPNTVTFTANISNSSGPIDGAVTITFRIYDDPGGGTLVWEETQSLAADNGLVFAELGAVDPVANGLDDTVFTGGTMWLDLTVGGDQQSPRIPIVSVPYAVRTGVADQLGTLSPADVALSTHDHDGTYLPAGTALTCSGGSPKVTGIDASTGNVICGTDADTTYSPGAGIQIAGSTISANFAAAGGDAGTATTVARGDHIHDARYVTGAELGSVGTINDATNPVQWSQLKGVPAGIADGVDSNTTYGPGAGLTLSGTTFSATYAGAGGDLGVATTLARSDHVHDARYYEQVALNATGGTINDATNPVDWSRLKSVPAGFADGTDSDTTYLPGTGLTLAGTTFNVDTTDFTAPVGHNTTTGGITLAAGATFQTLRQITIDAPTAGSVVLFGFSDAVCGTAGCGTFVNTAGTAGWDTDETGTPPFVIGWRARGSGAGSGTAITMYTFPVPAGSTTFYFRGDCEGPDLCTYRNRQVMALFNPQ